MDIVGLDFYNGKVGGHPIFVLSHLSFRYRLNHKLLYTTNNNRIFTLQECSISSYAFGCPFINTLLLLLQLLLLLLGFGPALVLTKYTKLL